MAEYSLSAASTMNTRVPDYSVSSKIVNEATGERESYHYFTDWERNYGYYSNIPELKAAIDALVMWTCGLGYTADPETTTILEHLTGNGKQTADLIFKNLLTTKKINGDSFAEILKEEGTLINLKVLNPSKVRIVYNPKGLILRYDYWNINGWKEIKKENMLHLINNPVASSMCGTSVIDACKWVIDARNEAMQDKRRALHMSLIRVIEVDSEDTSKYATLKTQWADAIKNGYVIILPKGVMSFSDVKQLSTAEHSDWIRYLENFFQKAVQTPPVVLGGSQEYTEAGSKVGMISYEVPHKTERRLFEQDLWNQLFLKVEFDEPPSLQNNVVESEVANTGQVGFQPNEVTAQAGRVE